MPLRRVDSQSHALLDLGRSMLHAYWLTDADEIYYLGIDILVLNDEAFFDTGYYGGNLVCA